MKRFLFFLSWATVVLFLAGCTIRYDHLISEAKSVEDQEQIFHEEDFYEEDFYEEPVIPQGHPDYIDRDTAIEYGVNLSKVPQEDYGGDLNKPVLYEDEDGVTGGVQCR